MARRNIPQSDKDRVCQLYDEGETFTKISDSLGMARSTVAAILRERNIPMERWKSQSQKEKKVIDLYNKGLSILDIMELTGIKSEQTIYRFIKGKVIPRRNR